MIAQKDHTFFWSIYETIIYITLKILIALKHVLQDTVLENHQKYPSRASLLYNSSKLYLFYNPLYWSIVPDQEWCQKSKLGHKKRI